MFCVAICLVLVVLACCWLYAFVGFRWFVCLLLGVYFLLGLMYR